MIKAYVTLKNEQIVTLTAPNWEELDKKIKSEVGFDNIKGISAHKTVASDIRQGRDK